MTVEERLSELETALARERAERRRERVMSRIVLGAALMGVLTFALITGAAQGNADGGAAHIVEAQVFRLADSDENERATLRVDGDHAGLTVFDNSGVRRAFVGVDMTMEGKGPLLCLYDVVGNLRAELSVRGLDPQIRMFDENRRTIWRAPE